MTTWRIPEQYPKQLTSTTTSSQIPAYSSFRDTRFLRLHVTTTVICRSTSVQPALGESCY